MSASYLLNCWKSHLNSCDIQDRNSTCDIALPARVIGYGLSCDINMRQKLIEAFFAPISSAYNQYLGHNCMSCCPASSWHDVQVWGRGQCIRKAAVVIVNDSVRYVYYCGLYTIVTQLVGCYNVFSIILIWRLILIYTINCDSFDCLIGISCKHLFNQLTALHFHS